MMRGKSLATAGALVSVALCAVMPACTAFDDYLPGTPFTPRQPTAAVTLRGEIHVDTVPEASVTCSPGSTMLWGSVKNTGDLPVDEVSIEIDLFGPADDFLGTYRGDVFNGEVETVQPVEGEASTEVVFTSLDLDQQGYFQVCAAVQAGSVFRTAYRTYFLVIDKGEE